MPLSQIQEKAAQGKRQFLPAQLDYITFPFLNQERLFPHKVKRPSFSVFSSSSAERTTAGGID